MKLTNLLLTIGLSTFLAYSQANACMSVPDDLNLKGSSYSSMVKMSVRSNCGFGMMINSKAEEAAHEEALDKSRAEWAKWNKQNPEDSSEEYWAKKSKFLDQLDAKYPRNAKRKMSHTLTNKEGVICIQGKNDNCETKGTVKISEDGKTSGLIEVSPQGAFVFSVNERGEKDLKKPYLKIVSHENRSAIITAEENGKTIGRMEVNGEVCTKSMGAGGDGTLELNGKEYTPEGKGCHGSYKASAYTQPTGELQINGAGSR